MNIEGLDLTPGPFPPGQGSLASHLHGKGERGGPHPPAPSPHGGEGEQSHSRRRYFGRGTSVACCAHPTRTAPATVVVGVLVMLALFVVGCEGGETSAAETPALAVDRPFERGPLTVHVRLDKDTITIAEQVRLVIVTTLQEGYTLDEPQLGHQLGGWSIGDYTSVPAALDDRGRHVTTREYELHPFLSGSYEIPPLTFRVRAHAGRGDSESPDSFTLTTERIPVEVTSLLDDQRREPTVGPIKSVVGLPSSARTWLWVAAGSVVLALGTLVALYVRRHRQRPVEALRYPAHELASAKLARLAERKLVERGEVKAFYREVSQILRQYIEDRFALHAPERTTEEFLREARRSAVFTTAQADMLGDFLAHCDQVKFAELTPTTAEAQRTFDTARTFIERTKTEERQVVEAAA